MNRIFSFIAVFFVVVTSATIAEATPINGRKQIFGILMKDFDSCGPYGISAPAGISNDLRVSWVNYVSFFINDVSEGVSSTATIVDNKVGGHQAYTLVEGGAIDVAYLIRRFHKRTPSTGKPLVTKFFTYFNSAGQFLCQISYSGIQNRRRL